MQEHNLRNTRRGEPGGAEEEEASAADAPARMRHLSVAMDGRLVLPLTSTDLKKVTLEEILNIPRSADNEAEKTWVFSNSFNGTDLGETSETCAGDCRKIWPGVRLSA
jgi:hypothetical protein